jgi:hypothetical protein
MTNYSNSLSQKLLEMHKPWSYTVKRLGTIDFCSYCRDNTGRTYVTYPCDTVRLVKEYGDGKQD